ncbi:MAG: hypothetical protein R3D68_21090 [Hyphomicrobiaceae bacterium]
MNSKANTAAAVALALWLGVSNASAQQVSERVRTDCTADYMNHCSGATNTQQAYGCMRRVDPRLSRPCLVALIKDGYVTRAEVLRRARRAGIDVGYLPSR